MILIIQALQVGRSGLPDQVNNLIVALYLGLSNMLLIDKSYIRLNILDVDFQELKQVLLKMIMYYTSAPCTRHVHTVKLWIM